MNIVLRSARALSLTTLLLCNQLVVPSLVLAEESPSPSPTPTVDPSPTPTPNPSSVPSPTPAATPTPTPSPSPSPSPTPTPTPVPTSITTTGNASAQGSSSTAANNSNTTVNGNISTSGCSIGGSTGCPVDTSNTASVSGSTSASGSSGNNSTTNAGGNGVIVTGTASGSATAFNALNTTVVTASSSGETASDSARPTASSSGTTGGTVTIANSADLTSTTNALGVSGGNSANNNGNNAGIKTGDSTAAVSVANMLNTTVVGSNMKFLVININADQQGNINLLQFWKNIQAAAQGKESTTDTGTLAVSLSNTATSSAVLGATAVSGENTTNGNGGNTIILSGSAFASANLVNFINTNLIGSQFLFTVINIFGAYTGDIVVPNAARFSESLPIMAGAPSSTPHTAIDNTAILGASTASASADSGTNQELRNGGAESIQSGGAYAHATTTSLLNSTLVGTDWFRILLNSFGSWNGGIVGWNAPDAHTSVAPYSSTMLSLPGEATPSGGLELPKEGSLLVSNTADSRYDVMARARSGGNSANDNGGSTTIDTGISVALANVFQMVNTTVIGSRFFFPMINIFHSWNGNLAVAYPNLHVALLGSATSVSPGSGVQYTVSYNNSGYEDGRNVAVRVELPPDVMYQGNSLGVLPQVSGNTFTFPVGLVKSGASGSFTINVQVNPALSAFNPQSSSLLSKLTHIIVPEVRAAGNEKEFVVTATIVTSDVAQDTANNTASITTTVVLPPPSVPVVNNAPTGTPILIASSTNNVGKFVYQKDTITFSVVVKNTGTATAQDTHSVQVIRGSDGKPVARITLSLGSIAAGATKKISYGLKVPGGIASGLYTSTINAVGVSEVNGSSIASDASVTTFLVRALVSSLVSPVLAAEPAGEKPSGEVLGAQTPTVASVCQPKKDIKPYALAALLTILFGIELLRRKHIEDVLRQKLRERRTKGSSKK